MTTLTAASQAYGSHVTSATAPAFGRSVVGALTQSEVKSQRLIVKLQAVMEEQQASALKAQEAYAAKLAALQRSLATVEARLKFVEVEKKVGEDVAKSTESALNERIATFQESVKAFEAREKWMKSVIVNLLHFRPACPSISQAKNLREVRIFRLQFKQEALINGIIFEDL